MFLQTKKNQELHFRAGGSGFILPTTKLYAEGYPRDFELNINEIKSAELSHYVIILNGRHIIAY